MTLHERIDAHASFHLYQISLEAEAAIKKLRRKADFPARSAGQKRRYQKAKQQQSFVAQPTAA